VRGRPEVQKNWSQGVIWMETICIVDQASWQAVSAMAALAQFLRVPLFPRAGTQHSVGCPQLNVGQGGS